MRVLGAAHTPLEYCTDVELVRHRDYVRMFLERERRGARGDLKSLDLGEGIKKFLGEPVREVVLAGVSA